jgi:hypothetical protein
MSTPPTTAHATIIFQMLFGEVMDVVAEDWPLDVPPELDVDVSVGDEPPNTVKSVFALALAEDIFSPAPVTVARTRTSVEACPHANEYHVLDAPRLEDLA